MPLSSYLKEKRQKKAISQKEVADQIGRIRHQFISNIERGASKPPVDILKKMCAIYEIEEEERMTQFVIDSVAMARQEAEEKWNQAFAPKEASRSAESWLML